MSISTRCIIKNIAILVFAFLLSDLKASAQAPEHGNAAAMSEVNFSDLAAHELTFPPPSVIHEPEMMKTKV